MQLAYWEFGKSYYVKNGTPTDELACIKSALRPLKQLFGHVPVEKFGVLDLEAVRLSMIEAGLCRGVINSYVSRIRRCFRWGVLKQIVPESVFRSLESLDGLKRG